MMLAGVVELRCVLLGWVCGFRCVMFALWCVGVAVRC